MTFSFLLLKPYRPRSKSFLWGLMWARSSKHKARARIILLSENTWVGSDDNNTATLLVKYGAKQKKYSMREFKTKSKHSMSTMKTQSPGAGLRLSHLRWSMAEMCDWVFLNALTWRISACTWLLKGILLKVLMCLAPNGWELPPTHKNIIKHDKLSVVSFVSLNLQSEPQTSRLKEKKIQCISFPRGKFFY